MKRRLHVVMSNDYPVAICSAERASGLVEKLRKKSHKEWEQSGSKHERYTGSGERWILSEEFEVLE